MKKQQIKDAFSLPELLIVMGIAGVISVMMLTIVKPNEITMKYQYYNAYNTLMTAAYNITQDVMLAIQSTDTSINAKDKVFPQSADELCKKLAVDPANPTTKYGYINTTVYKCSTNTPTIGKNATKESFTDSKLAFIASNSMRYYISPLYSTNFNSNTLGAIPIDYFVVWLILIHPLYLLL